MNTKKFTAAYWKEKLNLLPHPEGGAFREVYRAPLVLPKDKLTAAHTGDRAAATSIYFLLEEGMFSAFHRIASDELWHFYDGDTLCVYEINADGTLNKHLLGKDPEAGALPQVVIPAGSWFASRVEAPGSYALVGCTVAPGFDFEDFEMADRSKLTELFPAYDHLIKSLTY